MTHSLTRAASSQLAGGRRPRGGFNFDGKGISTVNSVSGFVDKAAASDTRTEKGVSAGFRMRIRYVHQRCRKLELKPWSRRWAAIARAPRSAGGGESEDMACAHRSRYTGVARLSNSSICSNSIPLYEISSRGSPFKVSAPARAVRSVGLPIPGSSFNSLNAVVTAPRIDFSERWPRFCASLASNTSRSARTVPASKVFGAREFGC